MSTERLYVYVGPKEIEAERGPSGVLIASRDDLRRWFKQQEADPLDREGLTATFVVSREGWLLVAPRRSEHIACAGGQAVRSAGEMVFGEDGRVLAVSNQSTGFCPEAESWPAVAAALDRATLEYPGGFTDVIVYRRCARCGERNTVKDGYFVCDLCGANLDREWNFAPSDRRSR